MIMADKAWYHTLISVLKCIIFLSFVLPSNKNSSTDYDSKWFQCWCLKVRWWFISALSIVNRWNQTLKQLSCHVIKYWRGGRGRETQAFGLTIKTLIKMPMANVGMPVNWKRPLVQPLGSSRDGPSAWQPTAHVVVQDGVQQSSQPGFCWHFGVGWGWSGESAVQTSFWISLAF